jgi:uncharacterized protein
VYGHAQKNTKETGMKTDDSDDLHDLAGRLRPIFEKYHIAQAILFGSLARGEGTRRSDVDLILVQPTHKRFVERYEGILSEITRAVSHRDVDLLIYTPEEFQQMRHRRWMLNVLQEGKIMYESTGQPT